MKSRSGESIISPLIEIITATPPDYLVRPNADFIVHQGYSEILGPELWTNQDWYEVTLNEEKNGVVSVNCQLGFGMYTMIIATTADISSKLVYETNPDFYAMIKEKAGTTRHPFPKREM
ncbi:MAG: hypothetical protein Q8O89_03175 [Nanoarchaeota archaeon]|nr:hypothetical protein [Nanoarchaeota archaeon]